MLNLSKFLEVGALGIRNHFSHHQFIVAPLSVELGPRTYSVLANRSEFEHSDPYDDFQSISFVQLTNLPKPWQQDKYPQWQQDLYQREEDLNGLKGYMVRNGSKIKISIPPAVQYEDPIAHPQ